MQVFKCKICGGDVSVDRTTGIAICEYCGTKQVLPLFSDDSSKRLYESGYSYLQNGDYDKAETVFNQLLAVNPQDAEIYWDIVLCKYGVTFVNDLKTGKYIPTCNRTYYESILNDKNYQNALKYSNTEQSAFYQESAETINRIQKGILAVSKKEKPFDIFISYKETDSEGNRTKDSIAAQSLYEKLTENGYKVFFSRITLEDKIGTEYEPYIYAALYSSKVMLTVCSSKENIESPWVKNEWSRFLTLRQNDSEKILIPLCLDMPTKNLPDEFALLSSFDMKAEGFEQEFLHGIKKLIPLPIMKAERRKKIKKMASIATSTVAALAVIVLAVFLPQHIKNIKYGKQYAEAIKLFENAEYENAATAFTDLNGYKDSIEMVKKCRIQPDYDAAMKLYSEGDYAQATWAFEALGDYEDSVQKKEQSELSWRKSLATLYAENYMFGDEAGYYITKNGTVENAKGLFGAAHSGIEITKHGKVLSLGQYNTLFALHEDGKVTNSEFDDKLNNNSEWHDIIKISSMLQSIGFIGLRSDGKIVSMPDYNCNYNYNLIDDLKSWTDIVDFKHSFVYHASNGVQFGYFVGLKNDGTLCGVPITNTDALQADEEGFSQKTIDNALNQFHNVKKFAISKTVLENKTSIVALTKDEKLLTYINGKFEESNGKNICDIISTDYALKKNGDLIELNSNKVLLRDIVYSGQYSNDAYFDDAYFAVTRNGNINLIKKDYDGKILIQQTENKTTVYDEWLMRLN